MSAPRALALLALIVLGFAGWHLRHPMAAAVESWRYSRRRPWPFVDPSKPTRADLSRRTR